MKKSLVVASLLALLVACGNDEELLKIKRDIAKVQEQIYDLERQQAQVKQEVADQVKKLDRKLDDRTDVADAQDQLHRVKEQMSEYEALLHDLEGKIADVKASTARVSLAPEPKTGEDNAPTESESTSPTPVTEVGGDVVQAQYRQAYLDYNRGKYDVAIEAFRGILANFPNSPVTEKAMYYLGNCLYQKAVYAEGQDLFEKIVTTYPNGDFYKQSLYYSARCAFNLGQSAKAVVTLQKLIKDYPDTQEAELARNFLKQQGFER